MSLASIDVGLKRIGVAICVSSNIVTPKDAILRKNRNQAARDVNTFLKEWDIKKLVVGYPSSSEDMQKRIKHFVALLELEIPYELQEENMSSIEAEDLMKGDIKYKRDGRIDSIAAKIILERYLGRQ
ncbi:Holliday junction resolvase RuvX [Poseidonibacter ostreae]|uniref:Putative pre-16S rRNA nuclease n=1 Tax=Poseidonibacter ostreae TaxID=2654171 RepID=A0A6L4WQ26_9BACT|nr:Holliday junction resolvase RuvX [Poseidonibacter ostreae]KAB7886483.1 Holliday junction resolvase RuvX [Poseidonibacter ostreae]KAB7887464.1 Holliday junction resolvase RuvX [Poseidonibacter ostreae]KAB7891843.1 Holliday junction resolvase RuvX [Poseidonibacter ostreae]MAC83325.1 Holliday junction resolvase RuvX [Arcobacter sp.]